MKRVVFASVLASLVSVASVNAEVEEWNGEVVESVTQEKEYPEFVKFMNTNFPGVLDTIATEIEEGEEYEEILAEEFENYLDLQNMKVEEPEVYDLELKLMKLEYKLDEVLDATLEKGEPAETDVAAIKKMVGEIVKVENSLMKLEVKMLQEELKERESNHDNVVNEYTEELLRDDEDCEEYDDFDE